MIKHLQRYFAFIHLLQSCIYSPDKASVISYAFKMIELKYAFKMIELK